MKYVFHPEALAEYSQAIQYYAEQRVDLAQAFNDAVENAVYPLREAPNCYPSVAPGIRRCIVRKFPYSILYMVEADSILILQLPTASRGQGTGDRALARLTEPAQCDRP
nr:type II toxin-antitoxin system RelE/ParE family toxin [Nodosilinea sp. TSF1-S3]